MSRGERSLPRQSGQFRRDAVSPLRDDGPVTEVPVHAAKHQERGSLRVTESMRVELAGEYLVSANHDVPLDPGDVGGVLLHRLDNLPGRVADRPGGKKPDAARGQLVADPDRKVPGRGKPVTRVDGAAEDHGIVVLNGIDVRGRDDVDVEVLGD